MFEKQIINHTLECLVDPIIDLKDLSNQPPMEKTWSYKIGYHMEIIINNPVFGCKCATNMLGRNK